MSTRQKGDLGERLAQKYLKSQGFEIVDCNVILGKYTELDIVAMKENVLHIVEVKTLYQCGQGVDNLEFPLYNITSRKLKHLYKGIELYRIKAQYQQYDISLDAIGCIIDTCHKKSWIRYYPNINEGID